jgi:hypothetical protein
MHWAGSVGFHLLCRSPHEPTGPRLARPDDKLRDMRGGAPDVASLIRATDVPQRSRGTKCPSDASSSPSKFERARGTPDAGCTRKPCVQKKMHTAHASNTGSAGTTGIPRAMVLRLIRDLLGAPGCLATVASCLRHTRLDPSIGGSGPHDFAVRDDAFVGA